ncbi:MAG: hypothetical protein DI536_02585 [Archangium gephyra]|uniref:Coenzyme Q-binding protein COQ10 START domain-containing protein n=1 Tax=Archangium gephyra TaxID=48 RepID=A0A2W5U565_9BACT|nr:MAG: hypothetical protein DI536_02585 [Archangium gephyra]
MVLRVLAPLLAVSTLSQAQPVEFPKLTDAEKKKLEANEVVVKERKPTDNRGVSGEAMAVVDAPTTEVWPVVRDCEHYAKFLPSTKNTKRTDEDGDTICHDEIELPFPLTNLIADTKSVSREDPQGSFTREWSFVRGTYRRNRGSWKVLPWGEDKSKTLVVYFVDSDPSMLVPDFILRSAQIGTLPNVFVGVRKRVAALRTAQK